MSESRLPLSRRLLGMAIERLASFRPSAHKRGMVRYETDCSDMRT